MDILQLKILFYIDGKIGPNKHLYFPFEKIYLVAKKDDYTDETILNALSGLTDGGYLENTEGGYRITNKGFIFIEAYLISGEIKEELRQLLEQDKKTLKQDMNRGLVYQWVGIIVAFFAILIFFLNR